MTVASLILFVLTLPAVLPSGWIVVPAPAISVPTGTMPQGMSASPDGATIAVVESGYNPPSVSFFRTPSLGLNRTVKLIGAFGRPVWIDGEHVLVAGANADSLAIVDSVTGEIRSVALPKGSYPVAVAAFATGGRYAVGTDSDGGVRFGTPESLSTARSFPVGGRIGGIAVTADGRTVFASNRSGSSIVAVDVGSSHARVVHTGLHPSALLIQGNVLYVAETDADTVGVYDIASLRRIASVYVGDVTKASVLGASPNALASFGNEVLVSLAAANSIALIRDWRVVGRVSAGRYPTDVLVTGDRIYTLNGKGEGAQPNPRYTARKGDDTDYVGAIEFGSLRADPLPSDGGKGNPQGALDWNAPVAETPLRSGGPIRHVFFVLKENRSYDQVLGDVSAGDGDARLAWFGRNVTPNQHALAAQYGLFDRAFTSGEVSAAGHMWADTTFANDYVERTWPPGYGGRRADDLTGEEGPSVPSGGYIWQDARRQGISFRDYGELIDAPKGALVPGVADVPSLKGLFDPYYVGWNLDYSDLDRIRAWKREFNSYLAREAVPQFEYIWLPNDHTYGSRAGKLTPASYIAINDYALGQMIDTISHSKIWASSAVFVIEDDAQDGPDHVSDQRSTLYVASPFARGGVNHDHFSTVSVLRTIEIILGMKPLSTYDAMARPLYSAFVSAPVARPFTALAPRIDTTRRNAAGGQGAKVSAQLDFSKPDAVPGSIMRDLLAHNH